MKTYRIQDLKKKKYGLTQEERNHNFVEESLDSAIMHNADAILKNRKSISDKVKQSKDIIDKEAVELAKKVNYISDNIGDFVDDKKKTEIQKVCERIVKGIKEYKDNVNILHERISNGKIRIAAIGWSGHGKSTFHKLYTGLGEEVFPTRASNAQDTTGTVVVLHYQDRDDILFKRTYLTKEEVMERINWYMCEIAKIDENWDINGNKGKWKSFEDIVACKVNELKKISGNTDEIEKKKLINGIEGYFTTKEWVQYLEQEDENGTTDPQEARHFIDIQDEKKLYLATKQVDIFARIETSVLKDFEIVDTKGMSHNVEARVNEEIKEAIDSSDSVFSLVKTDKNTERDLFFDKALGSFRNDVDFKDKHFVVINEVKTLHDDGETIEDANDTQDALNCVEDSNMTNVAYIGNLRDDGNNSEFAKLVIKDMLFTIVKYVKRFDEIRIKKCNQIKEGLTKDFSLLTDEISRIPADTTDKDSIIKRHIREIVSNCDTIIKSITTDNNEDGQTLRRYTDIVKEGKARISIFELITGRSIEDGKVIDEWVRIDKSAPSVNGKADGKVREQAEILLESIEKKKIRREIEMAIGEVYDSLPHSFLGINNMTKKNKWHIGEYVQDVAAGLNFQMHERINRLPDQDVVENEKKTELGIQLWKCFKLDSIFPHEDWRRCSDIPVLRILSKIFTERLRAQPGKPEPPCETYEVLFKYFTEESLTWNNEAVEDMSENNYDRIQDDRLKAILADMIVERKFDENIRNIYLNRQEIPQDITTQIKDIIGMGDNRIIEQCFSFYKQNSRAILSKEDQKAIAKRSKWDIISDYSETIRETPLSDVKSI